MWRRTGRWAGAFLVVSLACAGCTTDTTGPSASSGSLDASTAGPLVVGAGPGAESAVLAEIYAGALDAAGIGGTAKAGAGSQAGLLAALADGAVDVAPAYTGSLLLAYDPDSAAATADEVRRALPGVLPEGLGVLEASNAESRDALAVTAATAEKYRLRTVEDLAPLCAKLDFGARAEFRTQPEGRSALRAGYGCRPKSLEPLDTEADVVGALITDEVQVAVLPTTSPAVLDHGLVVLEDPRGAFIARQVVPVVDTASVGQDAVEVLDQVSAELTSEELLELNGSMSGDAALEPAEAAREWLEAHGYGR